MLTITDTFNCTSLIKLWDISTLLWSLAEYDNVFTYFMNNCSFEPTSWSEIDFLTTTDSSHK